MSFTLHLGDCGLGLAALTPDSVDSMVTDPPAGIGFMGKTWDGDRGGRTEWVAWLRSVMAAALRALKPGAHALVWALPRTSHWTATAIEDAGFEVRDVVTHHFGTGFPKSLNVSKAIDEAAGATREPSGKEPRRPNPRAMSPLGTGERTCDASTRYDVPATDAGKKWDGWGTALKPASEHWILARKPLAGTVAANVQAHGTGALNIDACRIGTTETIAPFGSPKKSSGGILGTTDEARVQFEQNSQGRWPANLVLTHSADCGDTCAEDCPVRELDAQSGTLKSGGYPPVGGERSHVSTYGKPSARGEAKFGSSEGGASRFFYVAKPTTAEREEGLRHLPKRAAAELTGSEEGAARLNSPRTGAGRLSAGRANIHPTVKSVDLMKWLIKLITPPGGLVLDPFAGSGTTGFAAIKLGMRFVGWELDPEYHRIAEARLRQAQRGQMELCA